MKRKQWSLEAINQMRSLIFTHTWEEIAAYFRTSVSIVKKEAQKNRVSRVSEVHRARDVYRGSDIFKTSTTNFYWLRRKDTNGVYGNMYYTSEELAFMPECSIKDVYSLRFHLRKLTRRKSRSPDIWDCVTNTKLVQGQHVSKYGLNITKEEILRNNGQFYNLMKTWPVSKSMNTLAAYKGL